MLKNLLQKNALLIFKILTVLFVLSFTSMYSPMLYANEPCPNNKCNTAIGTIDVSNPMVILTRIFSVVLSIASIGALMLIIYSGYKLLLSRGNKEAIQGAREMLTSAIVGLLFIVFSLVILSVIAGGILKIPGFG